jgi:hypothetical protein
LINGRKHDFAVERLERPFLLDQPGRQVFQEFRMAGSVPQAAEVAWGRNNTLAKMMLPDTIDHNSGSQWMSGNCLS